MPLHLPSLLCILFLLLLLLLLVLANRPPPLFSLFVTFVACSHTLLTHHTLTHTVVTSCVFVLAHPPALGSAYSGVLALDSFAPTCRARVRKEAGSYSYMTTLAILLMPNSYHYPPVKSLIAMPHSYDYPLVKSLIAMPNMTTL